MRAGCNLDGDRQHPFVRLVFDREKSPRDVRGAFKKLGRTRETKCHSKRIRDPCTAFFWPRGWGGAKNQRAFIPNIIHTTIIRNHLRHEQASTQTLSRQKSVVNHSRRSIKIRSRQNILILGKPAVVHLSFRRDLFPNRPVELHPRLVVVDGHGFAER